MPANTCSLATTSKGFSFKSSVYWFFRSVCDLDQTKWAEWDNFICIFFPPFKLIYMVKQGHQICLSLRRWVLHWFPNCDFEDPEMIWGKRGFSWNKWWLISIFFFFFGGWLVISKKYPVNQRSCCSQHSQHMVPVVLVELMQEETVSFHLSYDDDMVWRKIGSLVEKTLFLWELMA